MWATCLDNRMPCVNTSIVVKVRRQPDSVARVSLSRLDSCIPSFTMIRSLSGLPGLLDNLFPRHGLTTPADLRILAFFLGCFVLSSGARKSSTSATSFISKLHQHVRERLPPGSQGFSAYALSILFVSFAILRLGSKARYGWVADPYGFG